MNKHIAAADQSRHLVETRHNTKGRVMQECRASELDDGEVLCCDKIARKRKTKTKKEPERPKGAQWGGASAKETKNVKIQCSETKQRRVTNEE